MTGRPELAIAFDVGSLEEALALDARLGPGPEWAKVGLQLFTESGVEAVRALTRRGRRVFLDLKLHDIPNTVAGAAESAARLGVELLTVHAAGGEDMVRAAVQGVMRARGKARVVAVTLLTSLDPASPPPGFARPLDLAAVQAEQLELVERAGAAGIVCSAADLGALRSRHLEPFFAVTPGIRPAGGAAQDQKRVATIGQAVRAGAGLLVLGRAITAAEAPGQALAAARQELARAAAALTDSRSS